jgi:hypothetical protein
MKNSTKKNISPNQKATIIPNRAREHHAIAEYLNLLGAVNEVPNRKFCKSYTWKILGCITMEIDEKAEEQGCQMAIQELTLTEEEKMLNEITDAIFQEQGESDDDDSGCTTDPHQDNTNNEADDEDDPTCDREEQQSVTYDMQDECEVEVCIGKARRHQVRRAKVNHIAFMDIIDHGKELLMKRNLPWVRVNRNKRIEEELQLREAVFNSVLSDNNYTMPEGLQDALWRLEH